MFMMSRQWCRWLDDVGAAARVGRSHTVAPVATHMLKVPLRTRFLIPLSINLAVGISKSDSPAFRLGSAAIAAIAPEPNRGARKLPASRATADLVLLTSVCLNQQNMRKLSYLSYFQQELIILTLIVL